MNKALAKLNRDEVLWKAKNGQALNLLELSLVSGYSYEQWSSWKYRGLPLVQGKIPVQKAMEWVMSEEMIPETQTSRVYELCHQMSAVLFEIWLALNPRKKPAAQRKDIRQKIDEIRSEYSTLRRQMVTPVRKAGPAPVPDPAPEPEDSAPAPQPTTAPIAPSPFDKEIEEALNKARADMTLSLRELALALGYSYLTILKWKKDGLPLIDSRITKGEALAWRRKHLGHETYLIENQIPASLRQPPPVIEPRRWPRRRFSR